MKRKFMMPAAWVAVVAAMTIVLSLATGPTVAFGSSNWGNCTPGHQKNGKC